MPRARSVLMKDILTFLLLILLIENQHVTAIDVIECENLSPLQYCPPFDSSQWKNRASCKNCTGGTKYHCCKDYDSPKLNCEQDDYDCKEEIFVEGCAKEKFCEKGEEPILDFVKDQVRSDTPRVYCEKCYNSNRYNSFAYTSSAKYSECPRKKINICTPATHKVECGKQSDETSERFCRCDVKNGYYPYSHPDDHPSDGCSFIDYECGNDPPKCMPGQQLLQNYTCAALCKEGFYKKEDSDDCVSNPTTLFISNHTRQQFTKTTSVLPSSSPNTSAKNESTVVVVSTLPPGLETTTVSNSWDTGSIIGICVLGALLLVLAGLIAMLCVFCRKKENYLPVTVSPPAKETQTNDQGNSRHQNETENPDGKIQYFVQGDYINANAENIQISKDETGNRLVESYSEGTISRSRTSTLDSKKSARKGSKDTTTTEIPFRQFKRTLPEGFSEHFQTHSLDRKSKPSLRTSEAVSQSYGKIPKEPILDVKNRLNLSDEEYEGFVPTVLLNSQAELVKHLHIDTLLDQIAKSGVFIALDLRDISEEKKTSDKIRMLLRRLKEKGVDSYMPFKVSLRNSEQENSLKVLEEQELNVYKNIMAKRKTNVKTDSGSSDEEFNETDERTSFLGTLSGNRTSYTPSDGFELVTTKADIEQNNDNKEYLNSVSGDSLVDERNDANSDQITFIPAGDDEQ
ncbi:uncharacterized protein LOC128551964 [Mercenaria mercenaria]|uniref:uncharacterized protein LOC128551964 n=1 Tax=Mercenaria mercenaria TaxID=6596 RepID=UPI00234F6D7A|nr:uncharacterized protein LOC128551964 [Mercenaria mercenaria]